MSKDLKKLIKKVENKKNKLYTHMENDDFVTPDMLDEATDVIHAQSEYIEAVSEIVDNYTMSVARLTKELQEAMEEHFFEGYVEPLNEAMDNLEKIQEKFKLN